MLVIPGWVIPADINSKSLAKVESQDRKSVV